MTEVNIFKKELINLKDNIFAIGSCFSIEIKKFFKKVGIFILSNPFGTMYNSYSIYNSIYRILELKYYNENEIDFYNNKYFSFDHWTKYSSENLTVCLNNINKNIKESHDYLTKCKIFIITFGTSVVYEYKDRIVANCHKIPHNNFNKKVLTVNDNISNIEKIVAILNNKIKNPIIIFTLSPIRHKDELTLNCYSKSILRVAIEHFINNNNIFYFPSFEIVLDELRDYQYYKSDKIHLKDKSVAYIFDKFINSYLSKDMVNYLKEFSNIYKMYKHKPTDKNLEYLNLLINCLKRLDELKKLRDDKIIEKTKLKVIHKIIKYFYNPELFNTIEPYIDDKYKEIFFNFSNNIFSLPKEIENFNLFKKIRNTLFLLSNTMK